MVGDDFGQTDLAGGMATTARPPASRDSAVRRDDCMRAMTTSHTPPLGSEDCLVYTVAEAGELLGISRAFAYELVARGELSVLRLGRRRLVPKADLLAFVAQASTPELLEADSTPS